MSLNQPAAPSGQLQSTHFALDYPHLLRHCGEFRTQVKICWVDVSILPTIKVPLLKYFLSWEGKREVLFG